MTKRTSTIGIKVKPITKEKIEFIAEREARPMSTQINIILEKYIDEYFKKEGIEWAEESDE